MSQSINMIEALSVVIRPLVGAVSSSLVDLQSRGVSQSPTRELEGSVSWVVICN